MAYALQGRNDQEHLNNIKNYLQNSVIFGLKVIKDYCEFMKDRITYCGHEIDKDGQWKQNIKIESVLNTR